MRSRRKPGMPAQRREPVSSRPGSRTFASYNSMQRSRLREYEWRNLGDELGAVLGHAEVLSLHGAVRGRQRSAAGVLELLTRTQQRLVADDAEALYFFGVIVRIRDNPVA